MLTDVLLGIIISPRNEDLHHNGLVQGRITNSIAAASRDLSSSMIYDPEPGRVCSAIPIRAHVSLSAEFGRLTVYSVGEDQG